MEQLEIKRLGLILAVQAEIEGMKIENLQRDYPFQAAVYSGDDFQAKADEIKNIVYANESQI